MVYLGVDLHRKVSHVVALDEAGNVTLSRRLVNDPAEFRRVFGELEPEPIEVAFEATYGWGWFADLLADAGVAAHMAHPLATKAIGAGRVWASVRASIASFFSCFVHSRRRPI